jgi:hypothetical protein
LNIVFVITEPITVALHHPFGVVIYDVMITVQDLLTPRYLVISNTYFIIAAE